MLHALVKVVVLPLSSTGITTSCRLSIQLRFTNTHTEAETYTKHEITEQECWQLASARLDIGPGRTRSAGNQGQAQHGPSSEAQQPVKGCGRGRRLCRSGHEATSWTSSAVPLASAAPSKSWNHVLTQDGWRSPDTARCFQMQ